jgi:hypothetical protein
VKYFIKSFFYQLLRPTLWGKLFLSILIPLRTRWRVAQKGMYHVEWYPFKIKNSFSFNSQANVWSFLGKNIPLISDDRIDRKLNLAGQLLSEKQLIEIWMNPISDIGTDPEVTQAAHRFHWMLEWLAQGAPKNGPHRLLELITLWQTTPSARNKLSQAWIPYTVSERIVNLSICLSLIHNLQPIDKFSMESLQREIFEHLVFLVNHLEYPASGIINNHILNNARALYLGGQFLQVEGFCNVAKQIFELHLPSMIGPGGHLLESSSHYQLLLARSISEVAIIANYFKDEAFFNWISNFQSKMRHASLRLVPGTIVCSIGDVSPDMPIDWYHPINSCGWRKIWNDDKLVAGETTQNDGWLKAQTPVWCALTYSHPHRDSYPVGHGHEDFGSFVLYYKGRPIIIDKGRYSYRDTTDVSPQNHSTVLRDGKGLVFSARGFNSILSAKSRSQAECRNLANDEGVGYFWAAPGSERRLQILNDKSVLVQDDLMTSSRWEGYFYFDSEIISYQDLKNGVIVLHSALDELKVILKNISDYEVRSTVIYPSYGVSAPALCLHWKSNQKSSVTTNFEILEK